MCSTGHGAIEIPPHPQRYSNRYRDGESYHTINSVVGPECTRRGSTTQRQNSHCCCCEMLGPSRLYMLVIQRRAGYTTARARREHNAMRSRRSCTELQKRSSRVPPRTLRQNGCERGHSFTHVDSTAALLPAPPELHRWSESPPRTAPAAAANKVTIVAVRGWNCTGHRKASHSTSRVQQLQGEIIHGDRFCTYFVARIECRERTPIHMLSFRHPKRVPCLVQSCAGGAFEAGFDIARSELIHRKTRRRRPA